MSTIPEKLISFRVYEDGNDYIGVADVELPELEAMTDTVKGAGIAGEIDTPVLGHYSSMEMTLNWRTLEKENVRMGGFKSRTFDLRGAIQTKDSKTGGITVRKAKIVVQGMPKKISLGKLDTGSAMDTSTTLEVNYLKVSIDGETYLELDKYNYICIVDGVDYLSVVREALGLA